MYTAYAFKDGSGSLNPVVEAAPSAGGEHRVGRGSDSFDYSAEPEERSGLTLGGAFTGMVVALTSCVILIAWGAAVLQAQGFDLRAAVRGNFTLTSGGLALALVTALFVSFLWGGYTAGRMGAGAGTLNGALVGAFTLVTVGSAAALAILVAGTETVAVGFGIGELPLDGNFTLAGLGAFAGFAAAIFAGAIWGGVIGVRWHWSVPDDDDLYSRSRETDSFSDLRGRL